MSKNMKAKMFHVGEVDSSRVKSLFFNLDDRVNKSYFSS